MRTSRSHPGPRRSTSSRPTKPGVSVTTTSAPSTASAGWSATAKTSPRAVWRRWGADLERVRSRIVYRLGGEDTASYTKPVAKTPTLDEFGRDLTKLAREHKLDPVIGRKREIERVVQVLSRRTKNHPALIGEPGAGKTAITEGLAQRIACGDVPEVLRSKRVDESRKYVERDAPLERWLAPILVAEPAVEQIVEILRRLRERYKAHHGVNLSDEALAAATPADKHSRPVPAGQGDRPWTRPRARPGCRRDSLPQEVRQAMEKTERVRREKDEAIKGQNYAKAASLRGKELESSAGESPFPRQEPVIPRVFQGCAIFIRSRWEGRDDAKGSAPNRQYTQRQTHQDGIGMGDSRAGAARPLSLGCFDAGHQEAIQSGTTSVVWNPG